MSARIESVATIGAALLTASAAALIVAANYSPAPAELPVVVFAPHADAAPATPGEAIDALEAVLAPVKPSVGKAVSAPRPVKSSAPVVIKPRKAVVKGQAPVVAPAPVAAVPAVGKAAPVIVGGSSALTGSTTAPRPATLTPEDTTGTGISTGPMNPFMGGVNNG